MNEFYTYFFAFVGIFVFVSILIIVYLSCRNDGGWHYNGKSSYDRSDSSDNSYNSYKKKPNSRSSFRSSRKDKWKSDQEGYRDGMRDAIWGDSYHYITGHKGKSDAYKNGYTRGYEQNEWCDD